MIKFKKILIILISTFLILSLMAGCSANKSSHYITDSLPPAESPNFGGPVRGDSTLDSKDEIVTDSPNTVPSPLEPKKVITTIQMDFESTEFDKTITNLNVVVEKYKAYVENSNVSNNSYYNNKNYRAGNYTIRVPKANVDNFKSDLNGIGNLTSESTSKEDVTSQYTDTESRLKVITIKEDRILALLAKAEKIEDIIALENQLSQTIYEKESLKSSLIVLDDKVDYSTFYLNIRETEKLSNSETLETTFLTKVKNALSDSLYSFNKSMQNLIIIIIYLIPFIIILGIILYFASKLIKKFKIKKGIKKEKI